MQILKMILGKNYWCADSPGLQVYKSASLQVCKSASLQVCRSASLQVCSLQSAIVAHRSFARIRIDNLPAHLGFNGTSNSSRVNLQLLKSYKDVNGHEESVSWL